MFIHLVTKLELGNQVELGNDGLEAPASRAIKEPLNCSSP
jgi:hypothetical protein